MEILDLRVAEILEAKQHSDADKLLVLQIDLGKNFGKRQLVAGLKNYYSVDELVGKKIVVVTNIKFAKLRGVESQGMLLAGDDEDFAKKEKRKENVGLLTFDDNVKDVKPGDEVRVQGIDYNNKKNITIDQILNLDLEVKNSKAFYKNSILKAGNAEVKVERVKQGRIR